ncbi:MAG: hypothetical protein DHS20C18_37340 [Saprospiraceae bacterium]|nr:MAG: hypothetical protein DHS20C18_37340 [Saprospiraceae bacterium]
MSSLINSLFFQPPDSLIAQDGSLKGYDLVYTFTEGKLNQQLQQLFNRGIIPKTFHFKKDSEQTELNVTWGPPKIYLLASDGSHRNIALKLPMQQGTLSYLAYQPSEPWSNKQVQVSVSGWELYFTVNLSLADVNLDNKGLLPEVKQQLQKFSPANFSFQHLFLDFEDVNLMTNTWGIIIPSKGKKTPDPTNKKFKSEFQSIIRGLRDQLHGTKNPYILNQATVTGKPFTLSYSVKARQKQATFMPTGGTFSTTLSNFSEEDSTLNYLLMTQGKAISARSDSGLFPSTWLKNTNSKGAFVIGGNLILSQLEEAVANQTPGISKGKFFSFGAFSGVSVKYRGADLSVFIYPQSGTSKVLIKGKLEKTKDIKISYIVGSKTIGTAKAWSEWTDTVEFYLDNGTIKSKTTQGKITNHNNKGSFNEFLSLVSGAIDSVTGDIGDAIQNFHLAFSSGNFTRGAATNLAQEMQSIAPSIILPNGIPNKPTKLAFYKSALVVYLNM